jgi:hypothetical protein
MTPAPPEAMNQQTTALRRFVASSAEVTSRIVIRPVFVDDAGRRRKLIAGCGYLAALACIGYIVTVGISLTAGPTGPLASLADPQPPHLVDDHAEPTPASVVPTSRVAVVARATTVPQPRTVRPAAKVSAPTRLIVAPTTAQAAPPVITTTPAVPTTQPCGRRRGCTNSTTPTTSGSSGPMTDAAKTR